MLTHQPRQREVVDRHICVPIKDLSTLRDNEIIPHNRFYFYCRSRRTDSLEVHVLPSKNDEDFIHTYKDETNMKWAKSVGFVQKFPAPLNAAGVAEPQKEAEKYVLKFETTRNSDTIARKFGIEDLDTYLAIMRVHYDIHVYVHANTWWKRIGEMNPNKPEMLAADPKKILGWYSFVVENVIPDYKTYFEEGGAIQISRNKLIDLFKGKLGVEDDGTRRLNLMRRSAGVNPLNVDGAASLVLALGNKETPLYQGDAMPMIESGRIYIMSGYRHPIDEERPLIMGKNADLAKVRPSFIFSNRFLSVNIPPKKADAVFAMIVSQGTIPYQIYVVQGDAIDQTYPAGSASSPKRSKVSAN